MDQRTPQQPYPPVGGWPPPQTLPPGTVQSTGSESPAPQPGGPAPGPGRGGYWIAAGIVVLVVLSAIGILVGTGALGGSDPDESVEEAVEDLRGWDSVTYRGEILQHGEGNLDVLVTVDREGDMAGTLSRPNGGRAEYARIDGVEMIKADAAWWSDDPRREQKAGRLAGMWLRNAGLETSGMSTSSMVPPGELARDLAVPERGSSSISLYADRGAETVDGVEGRVLESVSDRVVVAGDSPPRLLAFQPSQAGASSMRVSRGDPAALAAVGAARTIRTSAADYATKLREPAKVALAWDPPIRDCSTPICAVGTRLTNTSSFEARGVLKVRMNGALKGYHPFRLAAGRSATVGTRADNPGKGRPMPMHWVAEVDVY